MSTYDSSAIRNIAFSGHGSSGKTLLCEALLKHAGVTTRVPAGIMDYATDEKDRGHSIDLAIARFSWNDKEITLLDVPGYQEFFQNAVTAFSVVESAVVVVAASDGITVNTRKVWNTLEKKGLPRVIVLTKLDSENVDVEDLLNSIQDQFGSQCIPLIVPDHTGSQVSKVYNVLDSNTPQEIRESYREKIVEAVVETDDDLLNKYLEGEEISDEVINKQLRSALVQGKIVPVLSCVPTQGIGVAEFLTIIEDYLPSPVEASVKKGHAPGKEDEEKTYEVSADAPFSAQIFKTYNDPFGRIVYFRVYSGTLKSSSSIYDVNTENSERVSSVLQILGKDQKTVDQAIAGEIVAVAKVENVFVGDTLVDSDKNAIVYDQPEFPTPMVSLAVFPKSRGDEQKITSSLNKLAEEDMTFRVHRAEETNEVVVSGMSNLHLELMLNRLKNRFKVECTHSIPKIPYREAITVKTEARYRHKKQSGGHGQFGEVAITMEPGERGSGYQFVNKIVGGVIPSQFIASSDKGIQGTIEKGILAGYPVVDVIVTLFDGKTHDVDSSDAAFQMAASKVFQEGFMTGKPVLLEPVQNLEVTVPSKFMGDISGNLNSRRGRITGSDVDGDYQTIKALVPLAELMTYSTDLKSITGGEGSYTMEFSHYDPVPPHVQDKIIARAKEEKK